jgi:hypothetical protein
LGLGSSSEQKDNYMLAALEDYLNYCLDMLRINIFDEIEIEIKELHDHYVAIFDNLSKNFSLV